MTELKIDLEKASYEEEEYWKLKSKENWLEHGDRNTRFFHDSVQTRKMKNQIVSLLDEVGVEHFDEEVKGEIAVGYFNNLFKTSNPGDTTKMFEGMEPRVMDHMNIDFHKGGYIFRNS